MGSITGLRVRSSFPMVGRSMVTDEDAVDFNKTPKNNSDSGGSEFKTTKELVTLFRILLDSYLNEFCSADTLRPLPPMTGDGRPVDLFVLFLNVSHKGSFDSVTENGSWDEIAQESGLGFNNSASAKLIYVKYLDALARWLYGTSVELSGISDDLVARLKDFLSEVKRKYELRKGKSAKESGVEFRWFISKTKRRYDKYRIGKEPEIQGLLMADNKLENLMMLDSCNQDFSSPGKRKRECPLETLKWLSEVAKDPSDPSISTLPDRSMWGSYGNEEPWKQLLLFRASRTNTDAACEKTWQKIQKMHPSLYEDSALPSYNLRERQSLKVNQYNEKKTEKGNTSARNGSASPSSDEEDRPRPLLGPDYQAEVPEWTEITSENDPKWFGTRIWPLSKEHNHRNLMIERDPIGKGRQDSCGCQNPGSMECVKFHITTKQEKLKLELGPAFYMWCFDTMGEGTLQYWPEIDQKKVKALITNPPTLSSSFFDQLKKILAYKSRGKIVSYFYNVILLQFRANQSRLTPQDISSDTDDLYDQATAIEDPDTSPKPVLLSPKKRRRR